MPPPRPTAGFAAPFGYTSGQLYRPGAAPVQTILIANPKGGCGKTMIATNVAGFLAGKRQRVVLADEDAPTR
jgi:hypothetical protein